MKRFLLYVFTYILITVGVAFGTISINNLVGGGQEVNAQTPGEKLLNGIITLGGAEVDIDVLLHDNTQTISLLESPDTSISNDIKIGFKGNINISSLDNIKLGGDLNVELSNNNIAMYIAYYDNKLYLSNETLNIVLETTSITKIFDILPLLGLNLDLGIESSEGGDALTELTSMFQNVKEERVNDTLLKLPLNLFNKFQIDIYTDNDYTIKQIVADNISISNYSLSLNADLNKDENIEVANPEEDTSKEYVDVTKTLNIVDSVKEILENQKLHLALDTSLKYDDKTIGLIGDIDVDYKKDVQVYADIDLSLDGATHNLKVGYINQNIYIDFNGLRFRVSNDAITDTLQTIKDKFNISQDDSNVITEILSVVPNIQAKQNTFSLKDLDINTLLQFVKDDDGNVSLKVNGSAFGIDDIILQVALDDNDELESISLVDFNLGKVTVNANIKYSNVVSIPSLLDSNYLDFNNLPEFVNALFNTIDDITTNKKLTFTLDTILNIDEVNVNLNGQLYLDFSDSSNIQFMLDCDLKVYNKKFNLTINYVDNVLYIELEHLKFSANKSELQAVVDTISKYVNDPVISDTVKALVSTSDGFISRISKGDISAITPNLIKSINISNNRAYLKLDKSILDSNKDIEFKLYYSCDKLINLSLYGLSFDNVNVEAYINLEADVKQTDFDKSEYNNVEHLNSFVIAVFETLTDVIENGQLDLNVNINVTYLEHDILLVGDIRVNKDMLYANLTASYSDYHATIELYLIDSVLYLDVDGLKVYASLDNLLSVKDALPLGDINVVGVLATILPRYNFEQILNKDLSSLDLKIIKSISLEEESAIVVISKDYVATDSDIVITLNYQETLKGLSVSPLNILDVAVEAQLDVTNHALIPEVKYSQYGNINHISNAVSSIVNTVDDVKVNKHIGLDVSVNAQVSGKKYVVTGNMYVDFKDAISTLDQGNKLDITKLYASLNINLNIDSTRYNIKLVLDNGYAYINMIGLKVKYQVENISSLVDTIVQLLPKENSLDVKELLTKYIGDSIVTQILNKDYSNIHLGLIKNLTTSKNAIYLTIDKTVLNTSRDITLSISFRNNIVNSVTLFNFALNDVAINANFSLNNNMSKTAVNSNDYFDISGAHYLIDSVVKTVNDITLNKVLALNVTDLVLYTTGKDIHVSGDIYVDFNNAITNEDGHKTFDLAGLVLYANIKANVYNLETKKYEDYTHNIELYFDGTTIYVKYNSLNISVQLNNLTEAINLIIAMVNVDKKAIDLNSNIDINKIVSSVFPNINIEDILNGDYSAIDVAMLKYLNIDNAKTNIILDKQYLGTKSNLSIDLEYSNGLDSINISGLEYDKYFIDLKANLVNDFELPKINPSEYSNLDNINDFANAMLNTASKVVDDKHIAFSLATDVVVVDDTLDNYGVITSQKTTVVTIANTSIARFDWSNAYEYEGNVRKFNIEKMSIYANIDLVLTTTSYKYTNGVKDTSSKVESNQKYKVVITYIDNVVYIVFNEMKVKIAGSGIGLAIDSICELLNINIGTDSFNNLLALVTSISSDNNEMLSKIKVEMLKQLSLTDNMFSAVVDITSLDIAKNINELSVDINYNKDSLEQITIKDLAINNATIDKVKINLTDFEAISKVEDADFIDMTTVGELIDAFKNTINSKDFSFSGSIHLKGSIIISIEKDIDIKGKIKLIDVLNEQGEKVDTKIKAKIDIGPIPVITIVNNDVNGQDDRMFTIMIDDEMVYLTRTETLNNGKTFEKKVKLHIDTFLDDALYYILKWGFGLKSLIMDQIDNSITEERTTPMDYSNIILDYFRTGTLDTLKLNLEELTNNSTLKTLTLGVNIGAYDDLRVVDGLSVDMYMPLTTSGTLNIDIKSNGLIKLNSLGTTVDMSDMDTEIGKFESYWKEGAEYEREGDGKWDLSSLRKYTLTFETNSAESIPSMEDVAGTAFGLPVPSNWTKDDKANKKFYSYEFAGWYTTYNFEEGTEFTKEDVFPRGDTTLFAKWTIHEYNYVTFTYVTNGGDALALDIVLEGTKFTPPIYIDLITVMENGIEVTKQFDGWYIDEGLSTPYELEYAPSSDITLYAKWTVVSSVDTYALVVYDMDTPLISRRLVEGDSINLLGQNSKFNDTTLYYLDSDYTTLFTSFVMPNYDLNLYVQNLYQLKLISDYGSIVNMNEQRRQGVKINIPTQKTYYDTSIDLKNVNEIVVYVFNGYLVNGVLVNDLSEYYIMPNEDIEIIASWTVENRAVVTVSFTVDWVKPKMWTSPKLIAEPSKVDPIRVVAGIEFDPSQYDSVCKYKNTIIGSERTFKVAYWSTEECGQLFYNGALVQNDSFTKVTSLTVWEDTMLFAVWYRV